MSTGPHTIRPTPRAALDAARVVFGTPEAATAAALWQAAQHVLQQVIGRPELTGQALVGEVRRLGHLTLSDTHALVALATWADRADGVATNEAERLIVREAWMALDHAADGAASDHASSSHVPSASAPSAPVRSHLPLGAVAAPRSGSGATSIPAPPLVASADAPAAGRSRRRLLVGVGALLLLVGGMAVATRWYRGRADRALARGIAAYQRGAHEAARVAFAQAAQFDPDDARPLVYLGRLTREDGDLPRARRFLTSAVRLAPGSSLAARELASLMLADGQPELARRFYVRAIELDPSDRMAQGFLGCALFRLQRYDEARRWVDRAGPGDWQPCVPSTLMMSPAPLGTPPTGGPGSPPPPPA